MPRKIMVWREDGSSPMLTETSANDEAQLQELIKENPDLLPIEDFDMVGPLMVVGREWGRMAIVDTKPFKLRVILHRIFVERPQVTGIPAWPGGAACYRRSRYIL